ncbi:SAM-dependent methyltransferase [[Phormidium ambiguum] IAM M-71]|uniref:SAM-dependent methyltransferase n=1 Tax=[Phormidium ambiguum] IAM M-71 TaxID=454136 RepID=A0A1U7IPF7_9CYAN|nr:class I SAM-dependent methyltransferase [Phormidium ambiguum]OKH39139.1 SAM-dependent methyltransferase [Phormidium ambiguum IAM M-71]
MTATVNNTPGLASRLVNGILSIKPLANVAKHQAREMMIKRAETIGVYWREEVKELSKQNWESYLQKVQNKNLIYPEYYVRSFHAYEEGNLGWTPALEVESAAHTVHSTIWSKPPSIDGDAKLRQSYHNIVKEQITNPPQDILDMGCSVGMSTFALQKIYPQAKVTGLDLSPYFLAVAEYRSQQNHTQINWVHAAAESTGLPNASFDLVSIFLMCHELPQSATKAIFREAKRLLRPNGHIAIMDMNPQSSAYVKMPPYVFTLLKSTEPYLDEYFTLDISQALVEAGFSAPTITPNSPRHRTIIAEVN